MTERKNMTGKYFPLALAVLLVTTACSSQLDRLSHVGQPAPMTKVYDPTQQKGYQPISWPLPVEETGPQNNANSLWQKGSTTFFRDNRAARVGDILKVVMDLKDRGRLESSTDRLRQGSEATGLSAMFGLETKIPGDTTGANGLLGMNSNSRSIGDGQIERREEVQTEFAATVTQVLPNGNLVIDGRQEIRINDEVREIIVQGVIRPQDIAANNTIQYSQIAEARIAYGGRGIISDAQRPRWGQEVIDILSPF